VAILPIRVAGDPVLRQKARKVGTIDASIQKLIDDMIETMREAPGVGLAANQVGVPLRIIVIEVPDEDDRSSERETWRLYTLINPQIVKRSGERVLDEGCLSVPGYKGPTPRSVSVTVKALDRTGKEQRIKAENTLLAEVLEHEIDHINGILYIDHLESMDQLVRLDEEGDAEEEAEAEVNAAAQSGGRS
jgi:peptide deformylase